MISRAFAITIAGGAGAGIPARLRWATSTAPDDTSLVVPRGQQRARIGVPISIGSTSPVSLLSRPATTLVLAWGMPVPLPFASVTHAPRSSVEPSPPRVATSSADHSTQHARYERVTVSYTARTPRLGTDKVG